jgi:hypothetical protein
MDIHIASAEVGPGVNWRGFLGVSKGSPGGIILQRFRNWLSLTVWSDVAWLREISNSSWIMLTVRDSAIRSCSNMQVHAMIYTTG